MNRLSPNDKRIAKWLLAIVVLAVLTWSLVTLIPALFTALVILAIISTGQAGAEYHWRNFSSRNPEAKEATRFPTPRTMPDGSIPEDPTFFTLILPAYNEASVIAHTLQVLMSQNYPHHLYEVLVTLRHDDLATYEAAMSVANLYSDERIRVYRHRFQPGSNKSTQMNAVLQYARGEFVSPVDAESIIAPGLLWHVDQKLHESKADVVQGAVQLTNLDTKQDGTWLHRKLHYLLSGWFAVHNVLEYRFWFSSRMFYQEKQEFVPLGGNTVFIRISLLKRVGGWDDATLTEDAALGIELSVKYGAKIVAAYTPELATQEHTPPRVWQKGGWFWQRVRWDQGFWQQLLARVWYELPTFKQRIMALYILATPLLQALSGLLMPLSLVAALFLKAPLPLTMLLFVPFLPMTLTLLTQILELREFSQEFKVKAGPRHYLSLIIGFFPYQMLLGMAAIVGVIREARGITSWSKTERNEAFHVHRPVTVSV